MAEDETQVRVLRTPRYDEATGQFILEVLDGFARLNPVLSLTGYEVTEKAGPVRMSAGDASPPIDREVFRNETAVMIQISWVRDTDVDMFAGALHSLAERSAQALADNVLDTAKQVTTAVGNVVDADGKPLSHDTINDALELMEISFDRHGNPKLPTLVASPQAAEDLNRQAPTPEQQNRRQEILLRKKREHDAKKRHRRLPRQSH